MDTLVHGWDIASATGQDTRLDPELVDPRLPIAEQLTSRFEGQACLAKTCRWMLTLRHNGGCSRWSGGKHQHLI